MPHLVAFKRKWNIGTDDFVFSGAADFLIRVVWLIVIIVVFSAYGSDLFDKACIHGVLLKAYFIGLICFLAITAFLAALIVYVSKQGTIANSLKRKKLPYLLYIRLAIAVPEVAWNAIGTAWAFGKSSGCSRGIVDVAKGTVISGWILLFIAAVSVLMNFNLFDGTKKKKKLTPVRSFKRGSSRPLTKSKSWEKRCKCLFCCASGDDRSTSVFRTLAELSSDYFKGVDLVPTDVVAGLILLSQKHKEKREGLNHVVISDTTSPRTPDLIKQPILEVSCDFSVVPKDWMTLDRMSYYLKFALGSYGWPFYVTLTNPVFGACSICSACRCFSCLRPDQIYLDNCCQCNTAAFKKTTGICHNEIVYASFKNDIYEIPFYVVIDKKYQTVVVAIRGTLSLQDVITDLVIERSELDIPGFPKACAHNGILQSAKYLKNALEKDNILEEALSRVEGGKLVITGHSLGAGAAALLAILLKPKYPDLMCFAYASPGELVSPEVSEYCRDFVCTVVLGDDIITRQGMLMMDDLKMQILEAIKECQIPKYKILASGCLQMCCGFKSSSTEDTVDSGNTCTNDQTTDQSSYNPNDYRSSLLVSLSQCKKHSEKIQQSYQRLYLPGQIFHIEENEEDHFSAGWSVPEKFTEIIVSHNMLGHHFPDALLGALEYLRDNSSDLASTLYKSGDIEDEPTTSHTDVNPSVS